MNHILVSCVILFTLLVVGESCMCMERHPQTAYCSAGFAIKASIISKEPSKKAKHSEIFKQLGIETPVYSYYNVLVMRVYKGNIVSEHDTYARFFEKTIQTSQGESTCGKKFTVGKSYLITGRKLNGELQVNQCDWVEEYSKLSKTMKRGLRGEYKCGGDECKINTCFGDYCENESPCKWSLRYDEPIDECTQKHRICDKNKNTGKCAWSKNMFYDACANKILDEHFKLSPIKV